MLRLEPRSSSDQGWSVNSTLEIIDIAPMTTECELKKVPAGCQLWHTKQYVLERNRKELRNLTGSNCLCSAEACFILSFLLYVTSTETVSHNPSHIRSYVCPVGQCSSNFLAPRTLHKLSQQFCPAPFQNHLLALNDYNTAGIFTDKIQSYTWMAIFHFFDAM